MTPHNGIMSWTPGHEIKQVPQSPTAVPKQPAHVSPRQSAPQTVPLLASPQLSPRAALNQHITWDDWYQRVSRAIYDQWQRASVGPGTARVRVTVFRSRDVDCQIVDFRPAADVERDAARETAFREAAIRCVYNLRKSEVLGFPYFSQRPKSSFDLDMRCTVNGPLGCDLAAVHDIEEHDPAARRSTR